MAESDEKEDEEGLLKPREVLDDRYRIEKELGRGGIGVPGKWAKQPAPRLSAVTRAATTE